MSRLVFIFICVVVLCLSLVMIPSYCRLQGEGFSAVPELYNQKVTPKLQHYIDEDESRTSLCALFFVKKGFPFVSILDGGFVQAHAWLCREGPKKHLDAASVLVDYDEDNSFFGKLEKSYRTQQELANATTVEKTQYALQNLIDSSMTQLTKAVAEMDTRTADPAASSKRQSVTKITTATIDEEAVEEEEEPFVGSPINAADEEQLVLEEEKSEGNFVSRFASKLNIKTEKDALDTDDTGKEASEQDGDATNAAPVFRNPFAARRSVVPEKDQVDEKADDTAVSIKEEAVDDPDLVDVSIAAAESNNVQGKILKICKSSEFEYSKSGRAAGCAKECIEKESVCSIRRWKAYREASSRRRHQGRPRLESVWRNQHESAPKEYSLESSRKVRSQ